MAKKKKTKVSRKHSSKSKKTLKGRRSASQRIPRVRAITNKPGWMGIEGLHLAFTTKDPHTIANFYRETLGFANAGSHRPGAKVKPGYLRNNENKGSLYLQTTRDSSVEFQNYDLAYHWVAQLGGRPPEESLSGQICLIVRDVDRIYDRLSKKGVQFFSAPHEMPWGDRIVECADPEGRRVIFAEVQKKKKK